MPDLTPLSPAAQAVMIAATNGNENVINDPVYKQCIAAALRAAADQVVPDLPKPSADSDYHLMHWSKSLDQYYQRQQTRAELLAIAAELLEQLSAQVQAPVPMAGWQPIDTAPKDGTEILASYYAIEIVYWWSKERFELGLPSEWINRQGETMYPAWWQPLPDHPPLPTTTPPLTTTTTGDQP